MAYDRKKLDQIRELQQRIRKNINDYKASQDGAGIEYDRELYKEIKAQCNRLRILIKKLRKAHPDLGDEFEEINF